MNAQTELFTGRQRKEAGIKKAEDNAGKEWNEMADLLLDKWLNGFLPEVEASQFMAEAFRNFAYICGLPKPPHERAFGSVMLRAARAGKIVKVGYGQVKNPKANAATATVWRKA